MKEVDDVKLFKVLFDLYSRALEKGADSSAVLQLEDGQELLVGYLYYMLEHKRTTNPEVRAYLARTRKELSRPPQPAKETRNEARRVIAEAKQQKTTRKK